MKYIKLYEDFSDKILDNLEDIKWIIVSFCDDVISYKLLTNYEDKLVIYSLSDKQTNQEEFESLDGRIKDLNPNYEYQIINTKIAIGLPKYLKIFKEIEGYDIINYTFNDDGSIDVNENVDLYKSGLTKLPFKFRNVSGDFTCTSNKLTSLEGCPEKVGGSFICNDNKLTSLEGSPKTIGGSFFCDSNKLTSLVSSLETVGGNFSCYDNKLRSLEGSPEKVGGYFNCIDNDLISLLGSPKTIGGSFYCKFNNLESLEGSPKKVGGDFNCSDNNLASLVGGPEIVFGNFDCENNNLTSLEGIGVVKGEIISDL